jgi:aldehyde dehydrogenase (NAD+)
MENIIAEQRNFFNTNKTKNTDFRIEQLQKLKKLLKDNEGLLNEAIYKDFKKSEFDTYTNELALLYSDINEACKKLKRWARIKRVCTNIINIPAKSYIVPEPYGVTLIIGAWNYPYQLSFAPAIASIAAGNTVILKPSEIPQNTSRIIAEIVNSNFDTSYFHVVEGGVTQTQALLEQKFDKMFFTGSVPVGKIIYQAAAKQLTPVTLELGGKSPAIVTKSCNLKTTAKRLVWAKFLNAGQTCIAPDYVFVEQSIKEAFIKQMITEIEASHFSFSNDNYVQIINEKNMLRLSNLLVQDKIIYGGKYDMEQRYFAPTLMNNVTADDSIMQDEIFGPILPIIDYTTIDETIAFIKDRPKPLSCYLFTQDKTLKRKIANELSFGGGAINDAIMHITNSKLPFGGVGDSGIGSYHGKAGFSTFTHYKSMMDKPIHFEPNLKYSPRTQKKLNLARRIMG